MVSLISVNVERSKHLDTVGSFLRQHAADIVCMQELCADDISYFENIAGKCTYAPMGWHPGEGQKPVMVGVGIFSKLPLQSFEAIYYRGSHDEAVQSAPHATFANHPLLRAIYAKDGAQFSIATTHFTWTPDGKPSQLQRDSMNALLEVLSGYNECIITGDFNAPRGGEIFSLLAERYQDTIPPSYQTSLDLSLHRAGATRPEELKDKMVDGLFSTPEYRVTNVALIGGVSDHCAITAMIERV